MKKDVLLIATIVVAIAIVGLLTGYFGGYYAGQIDYARSHIRYTIIEGKIIHIMGDAPLPDPEIKLRPIEEGSK